MESDGDQLLVWLLVVALVNCQVLNLIFSNKFFYVLKEGFSTVNYCSYGHWSFNTHLTDCFALKQHQN